MASRRPRHPGGSPRHRREEGDGALDEIITRSLMGETTPEEERLLVAWRSSAPENDRHYRSLAATWELSARMAEDDLRRPRPSVDSLVERAGRIEAEAAADEVQDPGTSPGRRRDGSRVRWWLAPAGLAAAAAAALLLIDGGSSVPPPPTEDRTRTIVANAPRTVQLPDGSAVHLAAGALLRYEISDPRNVWLEGRAYFGVEADPRNPFYVQTPRGVTRVTGTRFDVTARAQEMRVVVVEGRVEVLTPRGNLELGNGQQSRVVADAPPVVEPADPEAVTDWLDGVFIFQATPLHRVVTELGAGYGRELRIADGALADRTVTAVFADRTLSEILPALCRAVDAVCAESSDTIVFSLQSPPPNR